MVVFIYGSLLWFIFPLKDNISWEGHLSGFITGLALALFVKAKIPTTKKYAWELESYNEEEDEFLRHFDEHGNFIESKDEVLESEEKPFKITYHFRENKTKDKPN
jgi:hypothetical protein